MTITSILLGIVLKKLSWIGDYIYILMTYVVGQLLETAAGGREGGSCSGGTARCLTFDSQRCAPLIYNYADFEFCPLTNI
jgi:hypothetical protein